MADSPRSIAISIPATGEEEWQACREPLMSGWLTQGPQVERFENEFAQYVGSRYAVAASSGTTALHLILAAMGIGPGDEVIVPAFTWVATANVVLYCGATPVLADVDPATFNIDPRKLPPLISPRTRAIIAVHLFGLCADIAAIAAVAPGVPIVEDAACAVGSSYKDRRAGTLGLAAAFSFHPRKIITTGEGGMVTTADENLAARMRQLRSHGASAGTPGSAPAPDQMPEFNLLGFNYRLTDLQGAVGRVQLKKLDSLLAERREWASYYSEAMQDIAWLRQPALPPRMVHSWQSYVCMVDSALAPFSRNAMMLELQKRGISTRPGTHALHLLGYYRERYSLLPNDFGGASACAEYSVALPLHSRMGQTDFDYVVDAIRSLA